YIERWEEVQQALDDPAVIEELRSQGYDGAILFESNGNTSYAVFDADQIKMAVEDSAETQPLTDAWREAHTTDEMRGSAAELQADIDMGMFDSADEFVEFAHTMYAEEALPDDAALREMFGEEAAEAPIDDEAVIPESGKPFTFSFVRNTQSAPDVGSRFGQDVEPSGRYMTVGKEKNIQDMPNMESGVVKFNTPLVIDFGDGYGEPSNWKNVLSERYDGKTGTDLSNAIKEDGYDGIVTVSESNGRPYTSEIVDLGEHAVEAPIASTSIPTAQESNDAFIA
ncbi:unnamed protein product, partial [marine sediment metagenome]